MALRALTLVLVCGGAGANALLAARSLGIRELIPDSLAPPERVSTALLQEMECKNVETRVPDNVKMSSDHAAALAMGPASIRERSPRALGLSDAELMSEQVDTKVNRYIPDPLSEQQLKCRPKGHSDTPLWVF